jgi:hypothetical protein
VFLRALRKILAHRTGVSCLNVLLFVCQASLLHLQKNWMIFNDVYVPCLHKRLSNELNFDEYNVTNSLHEAQIKIYYFLYKIVVAKSNYLIKDIYLTGI